ncbi:hypothetical protein SL1157_2490 [Ruegeria lacuscaerulensis ITI-1157]|nr:hypothetical protein SL1157_2490 [Ruegeria lacuscaerulensis ITI-1157]
MPLACFLFETRSYPGPGSGGKSNSVFRTGSLPPAAPKAGCPQARTARDRMPGAAR